MERSSTKRLSEKTIDEMFLHELENEFEFSRKTALAILDSVKSIYGENRFAAAMLPGQVRYVAVSAKAPAGRCLGDLPKVEVTLTLDGGPTDLDTLEAYGRQALREVRILRLTEEALEEGGVLTEEDLARLLGVSERTIRRDMASLRRKGYAPITRGYLRDIGRGTSHKTRIVELWLRRYSYSEISRFSRHSPAAIQRYLITLGRVVLLLRRGFKAREIAFLCGISERLAREYMELLEKNAEGYAERIEEIAELVSSRPASSDKKGAA